MIPANGPVSAVQPRPGRQRPRGKPLTSERARELAIAREAAKRARRAEMATLEANAANPPDPLDSRGRWPSRAPVLADDLRNAEPIVLEGLVEVNGVLTLPGPLGASQSPAMPYPSTVRFTSPRSSTRASSAAEVKPLARPDSGQEDWARELAALGVEPEPNPVHVVPVPPLDPEAEAQRIAAARIAVQRLYQAIASPHLAKFSLPWRTGVSARAGVCAGCGQAVAPDRIEGHAVARANLRPPRLRCVRWCFAIPEDPA